MTWTGVVGTVLRSLPSSRKVFGSVPGSAKRWTFWKGRDWQVQPKECSTRASRHPPPRRKISLWCTSTLSRNTSSQLLSCSLQSSQNFGLHIQSWLWTLCQLFHTAQSLWRASCPKCCSAPGLPALESASYGNWSFSFLSLCPSWLLAASFQQASIWRTV